MNTTFLVIATKAELNTISLYHTFIKGLELIKMILPLPCSLYIRKGKNDLSSSVNCESTPEAASFILMSESPLKEAYTFMLLLGILFIG